MDELYKEIVRFQHRVNDYIDDHSSHIATTLKQEVQRLEDDAQARKNPRSIEDRVKSVIRALEKAGEEEVVSHGHADELIDMCEDFRQDLRKLF